MQTHHITRAYLAAIIESSDDAIISKDLNGVITSWNASAQRIFGYTPEEVIGMHISIIIPKDRLDEEYEILSQLKSGNRIDHFETFRRAKDGRIIELSITASPIRDGTGTIIGASKVARDITERRRIEEALREMNKRKDEFLANMSHELRTPMNAVVGLASILSMSTPLTDKQKQFINTLQMSADSLLTLINDLLDFSKLSDGSVTFEKIEFSLPAVAEKVISLMNVKAQEKNLALNLHYAPMLEHYFVNDPLRLQQVLTNLVSNAVKFTAKGSIDIYIESAAEPEAGVRPVRFRVKDTGIGIEDDKKELIFDKFTQADASITRQYGGSGLGLAITKSIVMALNGTIDLISAPGQGTEFIVTIPLECSRRPAAERVPQNIPVAIRPSAKTILLVEDYAPNALVATALLDHFGYNYEIAQNGAEALHKFENGNFHLILMDVQMPQMDGLEATRRIRQMEQEKNLIATPIIAITAHVQEKDRMMCLSAGMNDFLPKPFEPAMLADKLEELLQ